LAGTFSSLQLANLTRPPPVWTIQPREGLLVLFPSYVFHRTIPFTGDRQRISDSAGKRGCDHVEDSH
jgi:hypothetical protein